MLGQFEVGLGAVPGGGPISRLARLVGRGRALEILLGGDDIRAALAAVYRYVNRVVPDDELDDVVDRFARRTATFDKVAVSSIKQLVDVAWLPEDAELAPGLAAFFTTSARLANVAFMRKLFEHGFQQRRPHRAGPWYGDRPAPPGGQGLEGHLARATRCSQEHAADDTGDEDTQLHRLLPTAREGFRLRRARRL
jgi:hypothetical protein